MTAMLVIFFVEFASSRYLAQIDEQVLVMQRRESGSHHAIIEPVTALLARRKVIIGGKQVAISAALAGEMDSPAAQTLVQEPEDPTHPDDEESPLLGRPDGVRKADSRLGSHSGHHHYDPPPMNVSQYELSNVTRESQLLAVGIMEGGLCFHSIFVGLTLAVATEGGFVSLLTAIIFHRT